MNGEIIKTAFTKAKYSGKDLQLTLLALDSTLVDSHLPSPVQLFYQWKLKTWLPTQQSNTDTCADEHYRHLGDKADHVKMTHDQNVGNLLPLFAVQTVSILSTSRGIWIPGTVMCQLWHWSYLVCTTAGAVYHWTWKHLWDMVVMKPNPEPASATDTSDISNKAQTHMHAPQKPYMLYAPAATPPNLAAHQCITPSEQPNTPAKSAAAANTVQPECSTIQYWTKGSSTTQCACHQGYC